jgi:hypothetical protein
MGKLIPMRKYLKRQPSEIWWKRWYDNIKMNIREVRC